MSKNSAPPPLPSANHPPNKPSMEDLEQTIIELIRERREEQGFETIIETFFNKTSHLAKPVGAQIMIELAKKQFFSVISILLNKYKLSIDQFGRDEYANTFLHIFFATKNLSALIADEVYYNFAKFNLNINYSNELDYRLFLTTNYDGDTPLHILVRRLTRHGVFDENPNSEQYKIKQWFDSKNYFSKKGKLTRYQKTIFVLQEKFDYATIRILLLLDFKIKDESYYNFVVNNIEYFLFGITNNNDNTPFDLSDGKALTCAPLTSLQIALHKFNLEIFKRLLKKHPERAVVPNVLGITPIQHFVNYHTQHDFYYVEDEYNDLIKNKADLFVKQLLVNGAHFDVEAFRTQDDNQKKGIYQLFFPANHDELLFKPTQVFRNEFMVDFLRFYGDTSNKEMDTYFKPLLYYSESERKETADLYQQHYETMWEVLHNELQLFGLQQKTVIQFQPNNNEMQIIEQYEFEIRQIERVLMAMPVSQNLRSYDVLSWGMRQHQPRNSDERFPLNRFMLVENQIKIFDEDEINKLVGEIYEHFDILKQKYSDTNSDFNLLCEELSAQYQLLLNINQQLRKLFVKNQINQLRKSFYLFFDPNTGFDLSRTDAPIIPYLDKNKTKVYYLQKEEGQTALEQVLETLDRYMQKKESVVNTLFIHLLVEFAHQIILTMLQQNTLFRVLEERCIQTKNQTVAITLTTLVKKIENEIQRHLNLRCDEGFSVTPGEIMRKKSGVYEMGIIEHIMSYMTKKTPSLSNEDLVYFGFYVNEQHGGQLTKKLKNKHKLLLKSKKQLKKRQNNKRRTKSI